MREALEAWFPTVQRYGLMFGGLAGVAYETLVDKTDRPYLLILFGAMLGISEIARAFGQPTLPARPVAPIRKRK